MFTQTFIRMVIRGVVKRTSHPFPVWTSQKPCTCETTCGPDQSNYYLNGKLNGCLIASLIACGSVWVVYSSFVSFSQLVLQLERS